MLPCTLDGLFQITDKVQALARRNAHPSMPKVRTVMLKSSCSLVVWDSTFMAAANCYSKALLPMLQQSLVNVGYKCQGGNRWKQSPFTLTIKHLATHMCRHFCCHCCMSMEWWVRIGMDPLFIPYLKNQIAPETGVLLEKEIQTMAASPGPEESIPHKGQWPCLCHF